MPPYESSAVPGPTEGQFRDEAEAALAYFDRAFTPLPLGGPRTNRPVADDWPNLRYTRAEVPGYRGRNIGLRLGPRSGGLTDVDLDSPEAIRAADVLLPTTGMVHGRASAPRSHWWYISSPQPLCAAFADPLLAGTSHAGTSHAGHVTLVELRSSKTDKGDDQGMQTVVPPSLHIHTGERMEWDAFGEPRVIHAGDLDKAVRRVAAASLLARYLPRENPGPALIAIAGVLFAEWGGDRPRVDSFLRGVLAAASVSGIDPTTVVAGGNQWGEVGRFFDVRVVAAVREWLNLLPPEEPKATATPTGDGVSPFDDFNVRGSWEATGLYDTWTVHEDLGDGKQYLTRPGKDVGVSGSLGIARPDKAGGPTFYVFTSSTQFEKDSAYSRSQVFAILKHGGNYSEAAKALLAMGYGRRTTGPKVTFGGKSDKSGMSGVGFHSLPPYKPFPVAALPGPWAEFVREGARVLKCDAGYIALPVIAVLAGAVGMTRIVYLGGEWYEPAVWWVCIIGESGTRKSPAAELSAKLVLARQKKLLAEYRQALKTYKAELREWQAESRGKKKDEAGDEPEPPLLKRVVVSDVTIEKLSGLLDDNCRGLLLYRDELAGWIGSFAKYKGKADATDEPNWLSIHRAGPLIYDRKTGDKTSVFVPHAAVSVLGSIQPGKIKKMVAGLMESGFAARIVMTMPPVTPKEYIDDAIPDPVKAAAEASLNRLYELRSELDEDDSPRPVVLKLTADAKGRWKRFVNEWGRRQFEAEGDVAAAMSKLEGYAARYALIHHLAGGDLLDDTQPVGLASVEAGIAVVEWAAYETLRIYRMFTESDDNAKLRRLADAVTRLASKPHFGGRITARDLQRSRSCTAAEAEGILEALVSAGVGRWEQGTGDPGQGGKSLSVFVLNPTPDLPDLPDFGPEDDDAPDSGDGSNDPDMPPDMPPAGNSASAAGRDANYCSERDSGIAAEPPAQEHVGQVGQVGRRVEKEAENAVAHPAPKPSPRVEPQVGFTVVTDPGQLPAVVDAIRAAERVGLDIETTGLSPRDGRLRLLQLATPSGTFVVDCFAVDPKPLLGAMAQVEVIGHNLAFELGFLMPLGFVPGKLFDTMLTSQVLDAGDRTVKHGLAVVCERHLGVAVSKDEQKSDWSGTLTGDQLRYAALDAELPLRLHAALTGKLAEAELIPTADLENRALPCVAWAGSRGVAVDRQQWEALADGAGVETGRLAAEMDAMVPMPPGLFGSDPRNWRSTDEVKAAFAQVGIPVESTDDDTLAGIEHPLADLLRQHRSASKLAGTYGREWLEHIAADGRVYPQWRQCSTMTGRMSCAAPNLQQLPRDGRYRRCFVAPPGRVLVKADYSQIELRIAAGIAGDDTMKGAYKYGYDLHAMTAAAALDKPLAAVTKADRQLAKAINFGLLYGAGAATLVRYAKSSYGVTMTEADATKYRRAFFATYVGLRRWHERQPKPPIVTRTRGGRRRKAVEAFTEKLNTVVQGTAADGMKAALALLWDRRHEHPTAFPVLMVHDEIVVECDAANAERVKDWLTAAMTDGMTPFCDPVPVAVEAIVGPTWGG